ncbi:MAG: hypothetical protein KAS17_04615, partial [Victivallaceae bacterium]|nr:hypothetical protein [Victivallaceae bacterium]
MSFMFNPHPYDDKTAINKVSLEAEDTAAVVSGAKEIAIDLANEIIEQLTSKDKKYIVGIDGYMTSEIEPLSRLVIQKLKAEGYPVKLISVSAIYKSSDEMESLLQPYLQVDPAEDPAQLFGKLHKGDFSDIFDYDKLNNLKHILEEKDFSEQIIIVEGYGSAYSSLRKNYDSLLYLDVIPKEAVLRIKNGRAKNLGDDKIRPYKETLRRSYFFDFEIAVRLRAEILNNSLESYYLLNNSGDLQMMSATVFNKICSKLVKQPFRCKPVYCEGIWGGHYIDSLRNLPDTVKNCAWVFDLIP